MNIRYFTTSRYLRMLFCVVGINAIFGLVGILHTGNAAAVTNTALTSQAPMMESGDYYQDTTYKGAYRGWFTVAAGTAQAPTAWQKVYVPYNTTNPTTITITNGGGYCYSKTDFNYIHGAYDANAPVANYTLQDLDQDENMVAGGATLPLAQSSLNGGTGCHDLTFTIPASNGTRSRLYGHTGFKTFFFVAQLISSCGGSSTSCTISKIFQLNATNNGLIGFSRSVNSVTQSATNRPFGVNAAPLYDLGPPLYSDPATKRWVSANYDWTYSFQFAPRCDENNPASNLNVYDVDNGYSTVDAQGYTSDFQPQYLSADLFVDSRDNAGYSWVQQPGSPGPNTWSANQLGAFNTNNTQNTLTFSTNSHERYRLHMNQFNFHNVIAFYVPYDQFDADSNYVNCFASNCKITNIDDPSGTNVTPNKKDYMVSQGDPIVTANTGQTIHLRIQMNNSGAGPWTYDSSNPNSHFALGQRSPPSGSLIDFGSGSPPSVIQPGSLATFDVYVSSNTSFLGKTYTYQMQDAGSKWFGEQCNVDIKISGSPIQPVVATCTNVALSIAGSTVRTNTPTRVTFSDSSSGGAPTVAYTFSTSLNSPDFGQKSFDPFRNGFGGQLYPHVKYDILLEVQADSRSAVWTSPTGGTGQLARCLSVSCDPLGFNDMEVGDTTVGSSKKQSYGIILNNQTNQTYNPGIYQARIGSSGGVLLLNFSPPNPVSTVITNGKSTDLNTKFDVILISSSTINASLQFDLPGGTPAVTIDSSYPGILACSDNFIPKTKPYFKSFGGDVSAGGAFNNGAGSNNCTLSSTGDIKAFANSDTSGSPTAIAKRVGASTDFGAILTGAILTDSSQRLGFYSGLATPGIYGSLVNPTTFANSGVASWGGGFSGHCIYDYFSGFSTHISSWNSTSPPVSVTDTDTITGFKVVSSTLNISTGGASLLKHPTILVDGNAVISQNIVYSPGWSWSIGTQPPIFTLIVKGNIYIDQNVTQLDGIYVAQPDAGGVGGQIYTCTNGSTLITTINNTTCTNKLTVNGSFIAKQLHLLRTKGTLRTAFLSGTTETYASGANPNIAEQFNYLPELLMAAPTISNSSSTTTTPIKLDSLISLPPVL